MLPLLYPVVYLIWFLTRKEWFTNKITILRFLLRSSAEQTAVGGDDGLLPHRLVRPEDYETLSESHHDEIEDQADEQSPLFNRYESFQ